MAKPNIIPSVVSLVLFIFVYITNAKKHYNLLEFGAKPDGKSDSTKALVDAWANACQSGVHTTIYVPPGKFVLRNVAFRGPCKSNIKLHLQGTLVAPSDNWSTIANAGHWLLFENVHGIKIQGGILDGHGSALWSCKVSGGRSNCPNGAMSLSFVGSSYIVINGLTSLDSQLFHILIKDCYSVKMEGVTISASSTSPNTDGIHVQTSRSLTILNSTIATGDDCISIGPGTVDMLADHVTCGPGHGISVGSLGWSLEEPGVQNVTVKSVTLTDTQNGLRIKTWGRPSNAFAKSIHFRHAIMNNVQNPIVIDQRYCTSNNDCPSQASGVKISDVTYIDIHGTSATEVAVRFECSTEQPCTKIKLKDVKLTYGNQEADASCKNAHGKAFGLVQPTSCL